MELAPPSECPRCASTDVKLRRVLKTGSRCEYFCKSCLRYWVHGGKSLKGVAVRSAASSAVGDELPPIACPRCTSRDIRLQRASTGPSKKPTYLCNACSRYWVHGGARLIIRKRGTHSDPDESVEVASVVDPDSSGRDGEAEEARRWEKMERFLEWTEVALCSSMSLDCVDGVCREDDAVVNLPEEFRCMLA